MLCLNITGLVVLEFSSQLWGRCYWCLAVLSLNFYMVSRFLMFKSIFLKKQSNREILMLCEHLKIQRDMHYTCINMLIMHSMLRLDGINYGQAQLWTQ